MQKRDNGGTAGNESITYMEHTNFLRKRAIDHEETDQWHLSMLSWDARLNFAGKFTFPGTNVVHNPAENKWSSQWENSDSLGQGQTIYVMEADWPSLERPEVSCPEFRQ